MKSFGWGLIALGIISTLIGILNVLAAVGAMAVDEPEQYSSAVSWWPALPIGAGLIVLGFILFQSNEDEK